MRILLFLKPFQSLIEGNEGVDMGFEDRLHAEHELLRWEKEDVHSEDVDVPSEHAPLL